VNEYLLKNKNVFARLIFPVMSVLLIALGCNKKSLENDNDMLTREQIINRANELIISLEYSLDAMKEVYYDVNNKEWKVVLAELSKEDPDFARQYKIELKNRSYQAVQYRPDITKSASGALWVFVDGKTGEIITYCLGL